MNISPINSPVISYIYYPSQSPIGIGHCELEIEGNSYTLIKIDGLRENLMARMRKKHVRNNRKKNLSRMIEHTKKGSGLPFFRFSISVTPCQFDELRKSISKISGITCSKGVANALEQHADYKIPMLLALFPSTSAIYLTAANKLGSRRVYQIESYSSNSLKKIAKIFTGILSESLALLYTLSDSYCYAVCKIEYLVPESFEYPGVLDCYESFKAVTAK